MYVWALPFIAVMNHDRKVDVFAKTAVLVISSTNRQVAEHLAMQDCLREFPETLGYSDHQVSSILLPEVIKAVDLCGNRSTVRLIVQELP